MTHLRCCGQVEEEGSWKTRPDFRVEAVVELFSLAKWHLRYTWHRGGSRFEWVRAVSKQADWVRKEFPFRKQHEHTSAVGKVEVEKVKMNPPPARNAVMRGVRQEGRVSVCPCQMVEGRESQPRNFGLCLSGRGWTGRILSWGGRWIWEH